MKSDHLKRNYSTEYTRLDLIITKRQFPRFLAKFLILVDNWAGMVFNHPLERPIFRVQISIEKRIRGGESGGSSARWNEFPWFAAAAAADVSVIYLVLHTNFGCLRFAVGTSGFRSDKLPPRFEPPSISKSILYPSPPPGRSKLCLFLIIFIHGRPIVFR